MNYADNLEGEIFNEFKRMNQKDDDDLNFLKGITKPSWYNGFDLKTTFGIEVSGGRRRLSINDV